MNSKEYNDLERAFDHYKEWVSQWEKTETMIKDRAKRAMEQYEKEYEVQKGW